MLADGGAPLLYCRVESRAWPDSDFDA
jgi:major vault protein